MGFCCQRGKNKDGLETTINSMGAFPIATGDEAAAATKALTHVSSISSPRAENMSRGNNNTAKNANYEEDPDVKAVRWMRNRSVQAKASETFGRSAPQATDKSSWSSDGKSRSAVSPPLSPSGTATTPSPPKYSFESENDEEALSPPLSYEEPVEADDDADPISKQRYVEAVKLLHRNLIEKDRALTDQERGFLQDLLQSAINEAHPSADQLSAVESATETLDTDPLFMEEVITDSGPPSPTRTTQQTSPPRPGAKKHLITTEELYNLAKTASEDHGDEGIGMVVSESEVSEVFSSHVDEEQEQRVSESEVYSSHVDDDQEPLESGISEDTSSEGEESDIVQNGSFPSMPRDPSSQDSELIRYDGWDGIEEDLSGDFLILGTSPDDQPRVLTPLVMEALRGFLPSSVAEGNFWLKFSLVRHGSSLGTLLNKVRTSTWTIIAVETVDGDVFGSFTATPWRKRQGWFGSGESFLWRLKHSRIASPQKIAEKTNFGSEMEVYPFTGHDDMVQMCTGSAIAVGGGDWGRDGSPYKGEPKGIGFLLDGDLGGGETSSCATFASPRLCQRTETGTEFEIQNVEVWTITPCSTIDEAQSLELRKMFVEENRMKGTK